MRESARLGEGAELRGRFQPAPRSAVGGSRRAQGHLARRGEPEEGHGEREQRESVTEIRNGEMPRRSRLVPVKQAEAHGQRENHKPKNCGSS